MQPFHPIDDATVTVSVTSSTARGAIKKAPSGKFALRLHNALSEAVFYALGDATVEATTSDVPLPSGAVEVVTVENADRNPITHVAFISASGTGSAYASTGYGL
jgi:hypothetical protein